MDDTREHAPAAPDPNAPGSAGNPGPAAPRTPDGAEPQAAEPQGSPDAGDYPPFRIKDCALIAIATGRRAQNLRELRDILQTIEPESIYYHFWGSRLRPRFDDPEFQNDFAAWTHHALRDGPTAERLGVIDPTDFTLEELRQELIDVIEERLDQLDHIVWSKPAQQFNFLTSQIVVFDTHREIHDPQQLADVVPTMTSSSIFYHVIDARRRTPDSVDDFRAWLTGFGSPFGDRYVDLSERLADIDPFFSTLPELRAELTALLRDYLGESDA